MQFSSKQDVSAPIDHVFRACTDFDAFARLARSRGAQIVRSDTLRSPGVGMAWQAGFRMRGRDRNLTIKMAQYEPPRGFAAQSISGGLDAIIVLDLRELAPGRTRMGVAVDITARSLSARIILQSLKLARGRLEKRFAGRVAAFARRAELDWKRELTRRAMG